MDGLPVIIVPHPLADRSQLELESIAEEHIEAIIEAVSR